MKRLLHNVIVISDTHCGCRLGLCPPEGVTLDDGGQYYPSKIQIKVWSLWRAFWSDWVPRVTKGEPYSVIHNGDAIDGSHHQSTTQISQNLEDQSRIAYAVLAPVVQACGGRYYHIRGTEAHVGKSGVEEERLAQRLGARPNAEGQHARWELWFEIGGDARGRQRSGLLHFSHHIGTTGSSHHEASAVNAEIATAFTEAGRWKLRPPDGVVRSHRHRCIEVRLPSAIGYASSFVTAAWQLKTPFAYKIAGGRQTQPQIGGSLIRMGDEELFARHCVWCVERPEAVRELA